MDRVLLLVLLLGSLTVLGGCVASPTTRPTSPDKQPSTLDRDREAIRALAGVYEVVMERWGSDPSSPTVTTAVEAVRLVEDRPDQITLEHLLLIGEPAVIARHARQTWRKPADMRWVYEPSADESSLGRWRAEATDDAAGDRWAVDLAGADNRPVATRVGRWSHTGSVSTWAQATPTLEPGAAAQAPAFLRSVTLTATPAGWSTLSPTLACDTAGNPLSPTQERVAYRRIADTHPVAEQYGLRHDAFWQSVQARWDALRHQAFVYQLRKADAEGQAYWQRVLGRLSGDSQSMTPAEFAAMLAPFRVDIADQPVD